MSLATLKNKLYGLFAHTGVDAADTLQTLQDTCETATVAAAASTAVASSWIATLPTARKLKTAYYVQGLSVTTHTDTYYTFSLYRRAAYGAGTNYTLGSLSSATVSSTAGVAQALTLVDTAALCTLGDVIYYAITKTGDGASALGVGSITLEWERTD